MAVTTKLELIIRTRRVIEKLWMIRSGSSSVDIELTDIEGDIIGLENQLGMLINEYMVRKFDKYNCERKYGANRAS